MVMADGQVGKIGRPWSVKACGGAFLLGIWTVGALSLASPLHADTKTGVDAWEAGDYSTAVTEWREAATKGDADAAFNLGQAYKVGRGVPQSSDEALSWYRRAMEAGHVRASDYYGLLLYQTGRKSEAMPYVEQSAGRGEPRAQYVLGAELFNGTLISKDWTRAYAMMTRASAQGLEPANRVLSEMDRHIPLSQRQQASALAATMEQNEARNRMVQIGNWDLRPIDQASTPSSPTIASANPTDPAPRPQNAIEPVDLPPSRAAPASAVSSAERSSSRSAEPPVEASMDSAQMTGPEEPPSGIAAAQTSEGVPPARQPDNPSVAEAPAALPEMASNGLPVGYIPSVAAPARSTTAEPRSASPPRTATPVEQAPPTTQTGDWRVQMGAYSAMDSAQRVWRMYKEKIGALAAYQPYLVKADGLVKLQYGPFESRAAAERSCSMIESAGGACFALRK